MAGTRVVVEGGGENLYEIAHYRNEFVVTKVSVKLLWNDRYEIGRARQFDYALSLIRSHSGREIKHIG